MLVTYSSRPHWEPTSPTASSNHAAPVRSHRQTSGVRNSRGQPRTINNLPLRAPFAAFATGKNLVGEAAVRAAVSEAVGKVVSDRPTP